MKIKPYFIFFTVFVFSHLFWYLGQWPGIMDHDTLYRFAYFESDWFSNNKGYGWHSYLFYMLAKLFFHLNPNLHYLVLFYSLLASAILSYVFARFYKLGAPKYLVILAAGLLIINPMTYVFNLTNNREPISTWLFVLLVCLVGVDWLIYKKRKVVFSHCKVFVLSLLVCLSTGFRQDSLFLLLMIPVLYAFLYPNIKVFVIRFLPIFLFLALVINFIVPKKLNSLPVGQKYFLVSLTNPLKYILQNIDIKSIDQKIKQKIEGFVSVNDLLADTSIEEVEVFWAKSKRRTATEKERDDFQNASLRVIAQYPLLFLENRALLFTRTNGYGRPTILLRDQLLDPSGAEVPSFYLNKYNLEKKPISKAIFNFQYKWYSLVSKDKNKILHYLLGTPTLFFIVFVYFIFAGFKYRLIVSGIFLLLVISKYSIVFFFAPGLYYKYYFGLYVFGLLMPLMMTAEIVNKKTDEMQK